MKERWIPLKTRVLIRPEVGKTATIRGEVVPISDGGIVLPEQLPTGQGEVLAVGPEVLDVHVGDIVNFPELLGTKIKLNGEDLFCMDEERILGVRAPVEEPVGHSTH